MTTDIAPLAGPIDALYLIHNALRTEAERAEQVVEHLEVGSSFKAFQPAFYHWALVLSTYVEAEDRALTALVPEMAHAWETTADTARQWSIALERRPAHAALSLVPRSDHADVQPHGWPDYWYNDRAIMRAFTDHCAATYEFLVANGVTFVVGITA